jgi:hypothetical protein
MPYFRSGPGYQGTGPVMGQHDLFHAAIVQSSGSVYNSCNLISIDRRGQHGKVSLHGLRLHI